MEHTNWSKTKMCVVLVEKQRRKCSEKKGREKMKAKKHHGQKLLEIEKMCKKSKSRI